VKFAEALILDFLEEIISKEFFDEGMFEGFAGSVSGSETMDVIRVK
jgi:hypothetical protein